VAFTFGGDQKVTSAWGASVIQSIEYVTATNASYDGSLAPSASTSFGFQGTWSTSAAAPASLTCTPSGTVTPVIVTNATSMHTGTSSGCSSAQATCQKPMPDAAQAIPFWTSVASTFKGNNAVIFDLFNEPYASRATGDTTTGWQCWLTYEPTDPVGNLVASWHSYSFNTCSTQSCWTSQVAPVIAKVPVIVGEMGESDCGGSYMNYRDGTDGPRKPRSLR
jgi:hypothetical protein